MYTKFISLILMLLYCHLLKAQSLLKIYHGSGKESRIFNENNLVVKNPKIKMKQGEVLTIEVLNPNPLLYSYKLKYENFSVESEDKAITDLLVLFNTILSTRVGIGTAAFSVLALNTNKYKEAINTLVKDINQAKEHIRESDKPELPDEALALRRNAGLRNAIDQIASMSSSEFQFNNLNLLKDLNELSEKSGLDNVEKEAFKLLNSSLVEKVNEIKRNTNRQTITTIWVNEIKATDSTTKIKLIFSKLDKSNNSLIRDGNTDSGYEMDLGTIIPYYKRATLELIPVANIIFSNKVKEFYLENKIIQTRLKSKTTITPGMVLNINLIKFGERDEMSFGIGPGFKFNTAGDLFENFYISTLFSYKNFIRVGAGFGFAQFPSEVLKDGGIIGQPLPNNISNLNNLLTYEEKPSIFLTISFTGLNLSKKK